MPDARPLDPIDPTAIGPGLTAIPLGATPWDELGDGQHAVVRDGTVWVRRAGMWHRDPWWQRRDADEIVAVCADPDGWAYDMGWTRKHIEDTYGPMTPVALPGVTDA